MGSSVGVSKAYDGGELAVAIGRAFEFDEWILAEEMVTGREIEVAVLGDDPPEASLPGEIVPGAEFYDYDDKYRRRRGEAPRAGAARRRRDRDGANPRGAGVRGVPLRGDGAGRLLLRRAGFRGERAEHHPGVHTDLDVPAAVGGVGAPVLRGSSIVSSSSRSSATRAAPGGAGASADARRRADRASLFRDARPGRSACA